ncbi:hypothetical protein HMPREF1318_1049 [Actinomyces massiliensis F0489]|uniref:Uncharacterized protein n=1 Tax=Actinomyces massiliensis F0489 TaxID=1125718 RepID=J0X4V8_9ACTO|nr:hypothetical protein HMPREF1318_1049 [Actinomyces massiliensis F0489]
MLSAGLGGQHSCVPISMRNTTELGAEVDRSRGGTGPISAKGGRRGERVRARPGPSLHSAP